MIPDYVRTEQRFSDSIAAINFFVFLVLGPILLGAIIFIFAPWKMGIPFAALAAATSGCMAYELAENFQWLELDGAMLRGRFFWTRRYVEQELSDLAEVLPVDGFSRPADVNLLIDGVSSDDFRGYLLRFSDGARWSVARKMTDADLFITAVWHRWRAIHPARLQDQILSARGARHRTRHELTGSPFRASEVEGFTDPIDEEILACVDQIP